MKQLIILLPLLAALIVACGDSESDEEEQPAVFAPRDLTVLVGGARGTSSLNEYFPRSVEIRAGDTVTWGHERE